MSTSLRGVLAPTVPTRIMASCRGDEARFWGYLITSHKTATPVFEQLLFAIANYISSEIAPWDNGHLTPKKLATYYRVIGGDFDPLFLAQSSSSLSFVYQRIGCFHSLLQPDNNPNAQPSIPVLSPKGFVRWQTFDLLRSPREHVPLLQTAVKRLNLVNPANGKPFPNFLPQEALPTQPDKEIIAWEQKIAHQLYGRMSEGERRATGPPFEKAITDSDPESPTSTTDTQSLTDAPSFSYSPRAAPHFNTPSSRPRSVPPSAAPFASPALESRPIPPEPSRKAPRSYPTRPNISSGSLPYQQTRAPPLWTHARSASNVSASSVSSSSSTVTTDSDSPSPDQAQSRGQRRMGPNHEPRFPGRPPLHRTASQPIPATRSPYSMYGSCQDTTVHLNRVSTGENRPRQSPVPGINVSQQQPGPGSNVKWQYPGPATGRAISTAMHAQAPAWHPPPPYWPQPPSRSHAAPGDPHLHRARSMGGAKSPGVNHQDHGRRNGIWGDQNPRSRSGDWNGQDPRGRSGDWGRHVSRRRSGGLRD